MTHTSNTRCYAAALSPGLRKSSRTLHLGAILGCAGALLCPTGAAHSAETGSGLYQLGFTSPQAGLMLGAGTYAGYNFLAYRGDASASASASRQIALPGTGHQLSAQVAGDVKLDTTIQAHILTLTHVFAEPVLGGNAGLSVVLPYVDADLGVSANGVLSLTGPRGRSLDIPFGGKGSARDGDLGDTIVSGMLGWHDGRLHYIASLNVYAPTGSYDKNRAVNVGKNHWAVDPMAQVTYLNETSGLELSGAAGVTFNQTNSATDYKTGDEFHLDVAAIQHFSENVYAGLVGYAYKQLGADSGSGAAGDFKGRVYGLGPVLGGTVPLGQKQKLFVNARYYQESGAVNRIAGHTFFLTAVLPF
jgi:hypothetical protein